jgi:hypothetical protein
LEFRQNVLYELSVQAAGVENEVVVPTGTEEINDLLQRYLTEMIIND